MSHNRQQNMQFNSRSKPGFIVSEKVIIALLNVVLVLGITYLQLNSSTPKENPSKRSLGETQLGRFG
jgi:hypothetical protein